MSVELQFHPAWQTLAVLCRISLQLHTGDSCSIQRHAGSFTMEGINPESVRCVGYQLHQLDGTFVCSEANLYSRKEQRTRHKERQSEGIRQNQARKQRKTKPEVRTHRRGTERKQMEYRWREKFRNKTVRQDLSAGFFSKHLVNWSEQASSRGSLLTSKNSWQHCCPVELDALKASTHYKRSELCLPWGEAQVTSSRSAAQGKKNEPRRLNCYRFKMMYIILWFWMGHNAQICMF